MATSVSTHTIERARRIERHYVAAGEEVAKHRLLMRQVSGKCYAPLVLEDKQTPSQGEL